MRDPTTNPMVGDLVQFEYLFAGRTKRRKIVEVVSVKGEKTQEWMVNCEETEDRSKEIAFTIRQWTEECNKCGKVILTIGEDGRGTADANPST